MNKTDVDIYDSQEEDFDAEGTAAVYGVRDKGPSSQYATQVRDNVYCYCYTCKRLVYMTVLPHCIRCVGSCCCYCKL